MAESFGVRLAKAEHVFSAAHFITYAGDRCERLHGHNYHVAVQLGGPLDENQYVVDFLALRDELRSITSRLDHHVLLPTESRKIQVVDDGHEVTATFEKRRWVFPSEDCVLLPVPNTTTELLARYVARELIESLRRSNNFEPEQLRVEVDECDGQLGVYDWTKS